MKPISSISLLLLLAFACTKNPTVEKGQNREITSEQREEVDLRPYRGGAVQKPSEIEVNEK